MSFKTDKNNVFFINTQNIDNHGIDISEFMEENFTIYVKCKYDKHRLPYNDPSYIVSRNGRHSGICVLKMDDNTMVVNYSYWFNDFNNEGKNILLQYIIPSSYDFVSNEYIMICNMDKKIIECYFNDINVGIIDFNDMTKHSYTDSFIWLGCASMMTDEKYRNIGNFDFDLFFGCDISLTIDEISNLKNNYTKTLSYISDDIPILNSKNQQYKNLKFLFNFKHKTEFKVWNLMFNGNNLQKYIENNILF
jgi:hypothetical protein